MANIRLVTSGGIAAESLKSDRSVLIMTEGDPDEADRLAVLEALGLGTVDTEPDIQQAINVVSSTYGHTVSVSDKKKDLLKFGSHEAVGTGWETVAEMQDSETEETFVSDNSITSIISTSGSDTGAVSVEGHTIDGSGDTTFVVQEATLDGQTAVTLTTPLCRCSRIVNTGSSALVGAIAVYQGGATTSGKPNTDSEVHAYIPAGEQQTQKAATTISASDYYFITKASISDLEKTNTFVEARLEFKPVGASYWRPLTQSFSVASDSSTTVLEFQPYRIIPKNYDVRLTAKASAAGVNMSGGFQGYLASVTV